MQLKTSSTTRRGFTLLEVLIVIVIMATLLALTLSAAFKALGYIRRANTERTMQKVHERFGKRVEQIATEVGKIEPNANVLALAGGDRYRARVLLQKFLTRWSFPMSFDEIQVNYTQSLYFFGPEGYPIANSFNDDRQGQAGGVDATNQACLALIYRRLGAIDDLSGSERSTVQIGGQTFDVILDSWGLPMRFYRWPVDHLDGAGNNIVERALPRDKWFTDADDPEGLLNLLRAENYDTNGTTPDWYNLPFTDPITSNPTTCGPWVHNSLQRFRSPIPGSPVYCPMTLASAGPDGQWGLTANDAYMSLIDPANLGLAADNFYSYRSRLGLSGQ